MTRLFLPLLFIYDAPYYAVTRNRCSHDHDLPIDVLDSAFLGVSLRWPAVNQVNSCCYFACSRIYVPSSYIGLFIFLRCRMLYRSSLVSPVCFFNYLAAPLFKGSAHLFIAPMPFSLQSPISKMLFTGVHPPVRGSPMTHNPSLHGLSASEQVPDCFLPGSRLQVTAALARLSSRWPLSFPRARGQSFPSCFLYMSFLALREVLKVAVFWYLVCRSVPQCDFFESDGPNANFVAAVPPL